MKVNFLRLGLLAWIALLIGSLSLAAQDVRLDDRFYYLEGDSVVAIQLTTGVERIVVRDLPRMLDHALSPTNDYMVYRVEPAVFADEIAAECPCGGELPSNLVLVNLQNGESNLIGGQPENSTLSTGITRSAPVWSPDGTMLAWTEGLDISTLVIYNRLTGETIYGTDGIPAQALASSTAQITSWTHSGIMVHIVDFGETIWENGSFGFRMYLADGTLMLNIPPQYDEPDAYFVARYRESEVLAIKQSGQDWVFFDTISGNPVAVTTGRFALYSVAAPQTSLRLLAPTITHDEPPSVTFEIRDAQNTTLGEISGEFPQLAPFGVAMVQQPYRQLIIWRSPDDITTVDLLPNYIGFETALPQIEIVETNTPLITRASCAGSHLDIRLERYSTGVVIGDTPNNVRAQPNTSAAVVGQIAAGDWFDVVDGPTCSGGIAWWEVSTPNVSGWTAEGVDDEYFVRPGCPEVGCGRG